MQGFTISALLALILMLAYAGIFVVLYFKRRVPRRSLHRDESEPLLGTEADRLAAEENLRNVPADIREELVRTHELYDRFSTRHGYSKDYIEELTRLLNEAGIANEVVFQPTMPLGMADAVLEPQGFFELFIEHGKRVEAAQILEAARKF